MTAYSLGMLVGRILVSYLIVLVGLILVSKLNFTLAFKRSYKWYGVLLTVFILVLGLAVSANNSGTL